MSRKRTGLRHRYRNGRGTYSVRNKGKNSDRYGSCVNGKQLAPDTIAGHMFYWRKEEKRLPW